VSCGCSAAFHIDNVNGTRGSSTVQVALKTSVTSKTYVCLYEV